MNSARLKAIASNISSTDIVLDVGCDHGYLDIYLVQNNLCQKVYASDISVSALNSAKTNFQKYGVDIPTFVSDGFKDINVFFNTAVLAGMGTNTILKILANAKIPPKLILASHNELPKLRKSIINLGYKIVREQVVLENKHYYNILLCKKGKQKLKKKEILFGLSNNKEYYKYLMAKNKEIIKKVPLVKKFKLSLQNLMLKGLIEKK